LPWVIPSHQAPALLLKLWRPRWFSGLALVLGTIAPDLEFILRLDGSWFVSHTVMGQLYFTVPVVLILYVLSVDLVIPWLLRYLPDGPPFFWHELASLKRPRGAEWLGVCVSGYVGGLTHVFLDGFTHDDRSGWAVARFAILRREVLGRPVFELLQLGLTVVLGFVTVWAWRRLAQEGLLNGRRTGGSRPIAKASPRSRGELLRWLWTCVAAGFVLALGLRPLSSLGLAVERGAYGVLTFLALGLVLAALGAVLRSPRPSPRQAGEGSGWTPDLET
jgi:hypothetical protein